MTRELTCIICPNGCDLTVREENGKITVEGALCRNGIAYGETECLDPRRTLTTTVKLTGGVLPLVSGRSETPVRKKDLLACMKRLKGVTVKAPVKIGDVLFEDKELGLRLLATKNAEAAFPEKRT